MRHLLWLRAFALGCALTSLASGCTAVGGASPSIFDVDVPGTKVDVDPAACVACLPLTLSWGNAGGDGGDVTASQVSGCRDYTSTMNYFNQPSRTMRCAVPLRGCGEGFGIADLERALAHPDVQVALAAAEPFYGDMVSDGSLLLVRYGERSISLAGPCAAYQSWCRRPIPPGLEALRATLRQIDDDSRARCADAGASTDLGADATSR